MIKQNIIDAIIDFLASDNAGDAKGVYHPAIIKVHLSNVFNQAVYNTWMTGKQLGDFSQLEAWSRTYTIDVLNQRGTRAHAFLPFAPMQLPDNAGIRQIRSHEDYTTYGVAIGTEWIFAPIEATALPIFDELEVGQMDDYPTFRLEQNNLYTGEGEKSHMLKLDKLPVAPSAVTQLDVLMVVSLENIGDYDDLSIPSEVEDGLIRQVIDLMMKKPMPDTSNDQVIERKG